MNIIVDI